MCQYKGLLSALFLCFARSASASTIYDATVDTSSIAGTAGSLDFNFNPGPLVTQAANLQILSFSGNGSLVGAPQPTGDVSGALPGVVTFDNGTGFNDYFQGYRFGSTLSFDISFYGPALSAPDGISTSGSTFAFSMFSDAGGSIPALTTDEFDGFAFIVNVNLDGTTTLTNYSLQTSFQPPSTASPEPSSVLLLGTIAVFAFAAWRFRRRGLAFT